MIEIYMQYFPANNLNDLRLNPIGKLHLAQDLEEVLGTRGLGLVVWKSSSPQKTQFA